MSRRAENSATPEALRAEFGRHFDGDPVLCRAPGRVNLIGEHTDYNGGFVMPVAIGFHTYVAGHARTDGRLRVYSTHFDETAEMPIAALPVRAAQAGRRAHWSDYVAGVAQALRGRGVAVSGADLLVRGEVPPGAGLSSSAALEVATALSLLTCAAGSLSPLDLARACQQAENEFVGVRCGIMDQFTATFGRRGYALCLDCRSLAHRAVPLNATPATHGAQPRARIVICNTMVRHELAASEYNRRREQCERGVAALAARKPEATSLRDATLEDLHSARAQIDEVVFRRCRHVVTENGRVGEAAAALEQGALQRVGQLMRESHTSLRDDFEVSCAELDTMVRLALEIEGVYGARMTGGGFGGCTVNLVRADAVERFSAQIADHYETTTGTRPDIYLGDSADGAALFSAQAASGWEPWQRHRPA